MAFRIFHFFGLSAPPSSGLGFAGEFHQIPPEICRPLPACLGITRQLEFGRFLVLLTAVEALDSEFQAEGAVNQDKRGCHVGSFHWAAAPLLRPPLAPHPEGNMWKCQVIFIACEVTQGGGRFEYLLDRTYIVSVISTQFRSCFYKCLVKYSVLLLCEICTFSMGG